MKSVNLDRKLSSTTARIPKRSTVIQSPTGRVAQPTDSSIPPLPSAKPPVPSRKDQPLVDTARGITLPRPSPSQPPLPQRSLPDEITSNANRRPPLARATTAVQVVDDQSPDQAPVQYGPPVLNVAPEPPTPAEDEFQFVDAPHPQVVTEQGRRYLPPRTGTLLSELSALEYFIVKHVAALMLTSENSAFKDVAPLDDLLEMIDARKNTFWGKLFKGGKEKKDVKKKGASLFFLAWLGADGGFVLQASLGSLSMCSSSGTVPTPCMVPVLDHCAFRALSTTWSRR